jgi:hypothetical protein
MPVCAYVAAFSLVVSSNLNQQYCGLRVEGVAREECATTLLQGTAFEKNLKKGFCDVLSKFCVFFKI